MSAITIADLENAKLDCDHIEDVATSPALSATDRLGNTKKTLNGAISTIAAITVRGAWASATAYVPKDVVSQSGTWWICVQAHTSAGSFATDQATKWRTYQGITTADAGDQVDPQLGLGLLGDGGPTVDYAFATAGYRGPMRMDQIVAMMAAGEEVNIACYGDSGTDGNETTGWTANPVSGDTPVANSDHQATAPNAWPAKLETILRAMYGNTNINVFNAGYSGRQMNDGWARENYDAAITENPFYGNGGARTIHITLIDFGCNDIKDADFLDAHVLETERVLWHAMSLGTLPIITTSVPIFRSDLSDDRDLRTASRIMNVAKFAIAKKYARFGVECWDVDLAMRQWWERNLDGHRWVEDQNDGLHAQDEGHAFRAGFVAARLFRDTVPVIDATPLNLAPFDSRADYLGSTNFGFSNEQTGVTRWYANIRFEGGEYTPSQQLMEAWVWNEQPDCTLIYRHISNDGCGDRDNSPSITVTDYVTGDELFDDKVDNSGANYTEARNYYDRPSPVCRLAYGLNRVVLRAPPNNSATIFYGWFQMAPNWKPGWDSSFFKRRANLNALAHTGELFHRAVTGEEYVLSEESPDGANVLAFGRDGKACEAFLELQLDVGTGFAFLCGRGFFMDETRGQYSTAGLLFYRLDDNSVRLYYWGVRDDGSPRYSSGSPIDSYDSWATGGGLRKLKIKLSRNGDDQRVQIFSDWTETTEIFDLSRGSADDMFPYAGYIGDLWSNRSQAAANAVVHITSCRIAYVDS
jgi:lysophospholipase L1-like esterase